MQGDWGITLGHTHRAKVVSITMLGVSVPQTVTSLMDVYNSKAAALIRTQAIRIGQLTPLFGGLETQLGDSSGCAEPVDESLLTKAKAVC